MGASSNEGQLIKKKQKNNLPHLCPLNHIQMFPNNFPWFILSTLYTVPLQYRVDVCVGLVYLYGGAAGLQAASLQPGPPQVGRLMDGGPKSPSVSVGKSILVGGGA